MVFNFEVDATSKLNTILNKLLRLLECLTHFNIIYKPSVVLMTSGRMIK